MGSKIGGRGVPRNACAPTTEDAACKSAERVSLWQIAKVFLIIGTTGFGGGLAIIALIQDYCVDRLRWLSLEEFTHGVAFGQILSAFAVNATLFVGYRVRGVAGALVAGCAFLAPSVVAVIILSHLYLSFQHLRWIQSALHGVSAVVVALVVSAAWSMGKDRIKSAESIVLAASALATVLLVPKMPMLFVLLAAAAYGLLKIKLAGGSSDEKV